MRLFSYGQVAADCAALDFTFFIGNFTAIILNKKCVIFRENLLLGCGNPLLDISAIVDKEFLDKYGMKSDDAILAADIHKPLYSELCDKFNADFIAGGSVQNALRCAQWILEKPKVCIAYIFLEYCNVTLH